MKLLVAILLLAVVLSGVFVSTSPKIAGTLPIIGPLGAWVQGSDLSTVPTKLGRAAEDLHAVTQTRDFGIWHLILVVGGILLSRKVFLWLLQ